MNCVICSNPGNKLCGGCRSVNYCSKQCLVHDWKNGHKHTCATLPKKMNNIRLQYGDSSELITPSPGFISIGENITSVLSKYFGQVIKLNSSTLLQLLAYCDNEKEIKRVAKLLELDFNTAEYGAYDKQFVDYYGMTKDDINKNISSLTFKNIDKELKPYIKKNQDLLKKTKKIHLDLITKNKIKL